MAHKYQLHENNVQINHFYTGISLYKNMSYIL
jgi:hypothetical protein